MLNIKEEFPDQLLELNARQLHGYLSGPTLVHLPGKRSRPLFMSVLLHGNETTGWEVVRKLLKDYRDRPLPRALSIFIGNTRAARYGRRKLEQQPDYNRIWDGSGGSQEASMVQQIAEEMRKRDVFASIDIHNNSGINPHYACINRLDPRFLHLARRFSRTIIYFIWPRGVQSLAFSRLCPATTLECGQPGDEYGIQLAHRFVDEVINLEAHPSAVPDENDFDLYHTVALVRIPDNISFSFDNTDADLMFIKGIQSLNFEEVAAGTRLAKVGNGIKTPIVVLDENRRESFDDFFELRDGSLFMKTPTTPSMLSDDKKIVRQDCLCYLMERYSLAWGEKTYSGPAGQA